jgi:hypothetical protein
MRLLKRTAFLRAGILIVSIAGVCAAETPAQEAGRHFSRGIDLVEESAYAEAVIEFERAYEISPNYSVLYNLGEAYVGLGKPVQAADALTKYLHDGADKIPPERRADVEAEIRRQQARIATVTVTVDPDGATVLVDGMEIGKSPLGGPVRVGIGVHRFAATLAGHSSDERQVELAGEDTRVVALHLVPARGQVAGVEPASLALAPASTPSAAPSAPPPVSAPAPGESDAGSSQRLIGYAVSGLGVVGLGVGVGFGLVAKGKASDRDAVAQACGNACTDADVAQATSLHQDAQHAATVSTVGLIGGAVALVSGVVLVLTAPSSRPSSAARVRVDPMLARNAFGLQTGGVF